MAKYTSNIDYVQYALNIAYDDRYYYAHSSDKFAFSCSTLVGHALYACGYVKTDPKPQDGHAIGGSVLDGYLKEAGFKRYTWANAGGLKPGDVLIVQPYHVAFHIKDGMMVAANGGGDMVDKRPEAITVYPYTAYGTPQYVWRREKEYLKKGDSGNDVAAMQRMLIALGYYCGSEGANGKFNSSTEKALKKFQTDQKLEVDGLYDVNSKKKLNSVYKAKITKKWKATTTATCKNNNIYFRATASAASKKNLLGRVGKGHRFEVDGKKSGNWVHAKHADYGVGYISQKYVIYD